MPSLYQYMELVAILQYQYIDEVFTYPDRLKLSTH